MWLLDANIPLKLVDVLREFGIEAETSESRGWKALTNGELVETAARNGFTAILTRDTLFSEAAARALKGFPQFSVVLIRLPQLRGAQFLEEFRRAWQQSPISPAPGKAGSWPLD